ncbi:hypothetical protein D3C87_1909390 [compost metagenome]
MDRAGRLRLEVMRQIETDTDIGGHQRRQVAGLLHLLQLQQAGVDFLCGAGGVAESGQDVT